MNCLSKTTVSVGMALCSLAITASQSRAFTITTTNDPNTLANTLVGPDFTILSATYTGGEAASATFSGGLNSIGLDSGILLTTGLATNALGENVGKPNKLEDTSFINNTSGTRLLTRIVNEPTFDAAVLDFSFKPKSNAIKFSYVFGSDEYRENVGSVFNDVFGIFIQQPNNTWKNIALIPDTTPESSYVSINNVNDNINSIYFRDNTDHSINTEYDGLTTVLTATLDNLSPDQTYRVKLAIADVFDAEIDSGVFIKAQSFNSPPEAVPEPTSVLSTLIAGAFGIAMKRKHQLAKKR